MMNFILPFVYASYTSVSLIKNELFFLGVNTLTIGIYIMNIIATFALYMIGGALDRCLEHFWSQRG